MGLLAIPPAQAGKVFTWNAFAGSSSAPGFVNGDASVARFNAPNGIDMDAAGNLYVADTGNHAIRKITPAGVVSTIAGGPSGGESDGASGTAQFRAPLGILVTSDGKTIYVADTGNYRIRKIDSSGTVTTLAGSSQGYHNTSTGTLAKFFGPSQIAMDTDGSLLVSDENLIRKVTLEGSVDAFSGEATEFEGFAFRFPRQMVLDTEGNVYVADSLHHVIRRILPGGLIDKANLFTAERGPDGLPIGGFADGPRDVARFNYPTGLAADENFFYVADTYSSIIRKFDGNGTVTTLAGKARSIAGSRDGVGSSAQFNTPTSLVADGNGNVFVVDLGNNAIRKVAADGTVTTVAGIKGGFRDGRGTSARFQAPMRACFGKDGNMYVTDSDNNAIRKVTPAGVVTTLAGAADGSVGYVDGTGSAARFNQPYGIATDARGNLYVADSGNNAIRKITLAGVVTTLAGQADGSWGNANGTGNAASFGAPYGVAVDSSGNVFVADMQNGLIRKITPAGVVTTLAGGGDNYDAPDGIGTAAAISSPMGITCDAADNLYVADADPNGGIRKVTPAGVVTTIIKDLDNDPVDVAIDGSGNLYVAVPDASAVLWISPTRAVKTISTVGVFTAPRGVTLDAAGRLYVVDQGGNWIARSALRNVPPALPKIVKKPTRTTRLAKVTISGTLAGTGIVQYRLDNGKYLDARGTSAWSFTASLKRGKNTITIVSYDAETGLRSRTQTVVVTRL